MLWLLFVFLGQVACFFWKRMHERECGYSQKCFAKANGELICAVVYVDEVLWWLLATTILRLLSILAAEVYFVACVKIFAQ